MNVRFIGTGSCIPDVGRESPCLLIDGRCLIDTGWNTALRLRDMGVDPAKIESVVFTHFHQDHYLGLPQLLFHRGLMRLRSGGCPPLRILGPAGRVGQVVDAALGFLQVDRFPELRVELDITPMHPGDTAAIGELRLECIAAPHVSGTGDPEEALSYRFIDHAGAALCISGDTSPNPALAEFARGSRILVHDAAHTRPKQAAETARQAAVERLFLAHLTDSRREAALREAQAVFPSTDIPEDGWAVDV